MSNTDFKELYIEREDLRQIHGETPLNSKCWYLRANIESVPNTLGVGPHEYIGMLLYTLPYVALTPKTRFDTYLQPVALVLAQGAI